MSKHQTLSNIMYKLIDNYNFYIKADDTHRWIDPDGFYEVEFYLCHDDYKDIYLYTKSGDQSLEDEWSNNNPQKAELNDFLYIFDDSYTNIIFDNVANNIPTDVKDDIIKLNNEAIKKDL
jgi:hypothetical protein